MVWPGGGDQEQAGGRHKQEGSSAEHPGVTLSASVCREGQRRGQSKSHLPGLQERIILSEREK